MTQGIVFDLDSTLVDSRDHIVRYNRDMFAFLGRPFPEDRMEIFYTLDKDSLDRALFDAEELARAEAFRRQDSYVARLPEIVPLPGADELLKALAGTGLKLGILTNRGSSTPLLLRQLGWSDYFDDVLSADILAKPKPDAFGLRQIAATWQTDCGRLLFVGDSHIDRACAIAAGSRFLQVTAVSPPLSGVDAVPHLADVLRFAGV